MTLHSVLDYITRKEILDFVAKTEWPTLIGILALVFRSGIAKLIDGINLTKVSGPLGLQAEFERRLDNAEQLATGGAPDTVSHDLDWDQIPDETKGGGLPGSESPDKHSSNQKAEARPTASVSAVLKRRQPDPPSIPGTVPFAGASLWKIPARQRILEAWKLLAERLEKACHAMQPTYENNSTLGVAAWQLANRLNMSLEDQLSIRALYKTMTLALNEGTVVTETDAARFMATVLVLTTRIPKVQKHIDP